MGSRREAVRNQRIAFIAILGIVSVVVTVLTLINSIEAQAASAEVSYKYYTSIQVESGDTLWDIANTYMTEEYDTIHDYMDEVCSINHIAQNDIHSGQYLTIPYYSNQYIE